MCLIMVLCCCYILLCLKNNTITGMHSKVSFWLHKIGNQKCEHFGSRLVGLARLKVVRWERLTLDAFH
ncbi:hypothetical protein BSZ04_06110 [Vibrio rotiferianus]|nr:hypothetical protein BSZ04_06110 [Vibrio rotiferianus]